MYFFERLKIIQNLQSEFKGRLIIIDEIHNVSDIENNSKSNSMDKKIAKNLMDLVKAVDNIRLLMLSATPMFNNYKAIIWLLNLMNINDKRSYVENSRIFDKNGDFIIDDNGNEVGKNLLIRKSIGYISYIRGDNPYIFPFRVYPNIFAIDHTFVDPYNKYPTFQLNGKLVENPIKMIA